MDRHPLNGWTMVICNPISGSGRGLSSLAVLRRTFDAAGVQYAYEVTNGRGEPARIARQATAAGCSAIVVIGGDGTLFEAVNGVMPPYEEGSTHNRSEGPVLGLVQAGRGSDFGRSIGIPSDVAAACARLLDGRTARIDLGHVIYKPISGGNDRRGRYFANAAGMGFDAEVTLRANMGPRVLGGTIPYLASLVRTLGSYRNKTISVSVDGAEPWTSRVNSIVVANGQYFGGGMKIAPDAALADALLDVAVLGDFGKLDLVRNVPRVYDGSHVTHPKFSMSKATHVTVQPAERMLLQADGELLGMGPALFTVVPDALSMIV